VVIPPDRRPARCARPVFFPVGGTFHYACQGRLVIAVAAVLIVIANLIMITAVVVLVRGPRHRDAGGTRPR
jgi:hypothetical protein